MRTTHYGPILEDASVASNEAAPSTSAHGVDSTDADLSEIVWYLSGGTSCDCTYYWYDSVADAWCAGETVNIVGDAVLTQHTFGGRCDLQITNLTGTYQRNYRLVAKGA